MGAAVDDGTPEEGLSSGVAGADSHARLSTVGNGWTDPTFRPLSVGRWAAWQSWVIRRWRWSFVRRYVRVADKIGTVEVDGKADEFYC